MDRFLGPVILGTTASCFTFGLTTQQTFMYFHYFPDDQRWMKISVALIWVLNVCHLAPMIYGMYYMAVAHFGDIAALAEWFRWPVNVHNIISVLIIVVVQLLYTYRLWCLGDGNGYVRYLCYAISIWILTGCGVGIALAYNISKMIFYDMNVLWGMKSVFAMSMVTDVVIAAAMCYHLQKCKSKFITNSRFNSKVSRMMQYVVGSGVLTSVFSMASLIVYSVFPKNLTFFGISCPGITVSGLSYLALLNARDGLRREDTEHVVQALNIRTYHDQPSFSISL